MKYVFNSLSVIGVIILLIIALITTNNPFKWIEGISIMSTGYPKFLFFWVGYCIIYLICIWGLYYILNIILSAFNNIKTRVKIGRNI